MTKRTRLVTAVLAVIFYAALSPKWLVPGAAWIAPALALLTIHGMKWSKALFTIIAILFISGVVANYGVMPFPAFVMVLVTLQTSVLGSAPFLISHIFPVRGPVSTLVYPSAAVLLEYISSFMDSGVWGSIANAQTGFLALVQIVSVTGIWGVSFLIYWFSSILAYTYLNRNNFRRIAVVFGITLAAVVGFGTVRLAYSTRSNQAVSVSGIADWNIKPLTQAYEDVFGTRLYINESTVSQTSPELAELNKALIQFVEDPMNVRFERTRHKLVQFQDSLLEVASNELKAGAEIVVFSEALMFTPKPEEHTLIGKVSRLSAQYKARIILTIASVIPGKVEPGRRFLENKALMIHNGVVESTFFKNRPVPLVEASIVGDGSVPVHSSEHGRLAISICYDADFPPLMRKAGTQAADIMFLPSGDWREVSPYHGQMARLRAIENGFALFRPVSGAVSIATDPFGRIISSKDFYGGTDRVLRAKVPVGGLSTIYSAAGDVLPWCCAIFMIGIVGVRIVSLKETKNITAPDLFDRQC